MKDSKRQDWNESTRVGELALDAVLRFLQSDAAKEHWKHVRLIEPVEGNAFYQKKDIDLVLITNNGKALGKVTLEVKGDRNDKTGNFFLETVSDVSRNKPGAFIVCEADWYFYFFVNTAHLYCWPMVAARKWFESAKGLRERTSSSNREGRKWETKGILAPIKEMMANVSGSIAFKETNGNWSLLNTGR